MRPSVLVLLAPLLGCAPQSAGACWPRNAAGTSCAGARMGARCMLWQTDATRSESGACLPLSALYGSDNTLVCLAYACDPSATVDQYGLAVHCVPANPPWAYSLAVRACQSNGDCATDPSAVGMRHLPTVGDGAAVQSACLSLGGVQGCVPVLCR